MGVNEQSLKRFHLDVGKYADKTVPEAYVKAQRKLALEALSRIVLRTPVDTGRARGNWIVTIGAATNRQRIGRSVGDEGERSFSNISVSSGKRVIDRVRFGQSIIIQNNVDYIGFLEDGSSSAQAPNGMVAVTLAELNAENQVIPGPPERKV